MVQSASVSSKEFELCPPGCANSTGVHSDPQTSYPNGATKLDRGVLPEGQRTRGPGMCAARLAGSPIFRRFRCGRISLFSSRRMHA
jgi:hypothetical protein